MITKLKYPNEIAAQVAENEKAKRKKRGLTQSELAKRAGVSLGSLKRFEQSGEISFVSLIKIAAVLDEEESVYKLFSSREYMSIQEVIDEQNF